MTARESILAHARSVDRFKPEELCYELPGQNVAEECRKLVAIGLLVTIHTSRDKHYYAEPRHALTAPQDPRLAARKHDLIKLEAECAATRRTLASV